MCHEQGEDAEPEALRTEAEVGAVLYQMGQRERGMAKLDSVIAILDSREHRQFNWLDATVIALKRKLWRLKIEGKYIETIPLARRIIDRLGDYEQHPQDYHDGSYREPADSTDRIYYGNTRKDAADINFADDFIYEEMDKPLGKRIVPIIPMLRDEALHSFQMWTEKNDKTEY